ncbi:MAG TPA: cytosine permease [Terriglobales bacterium]|jgi:cytosine permease
MPLPKYLLAATANPESNRRAWYKNTAPAYAGIFLSVVFYLQLSSIPLGSDGIGMGLIALAVGGLLCCMFYYAPAMLGMKTGQHLYVVGTSTFGVQGNYFPGLLMGLLQVGFIGANTYFAVDFIMRGLHAGSPELRVALVIVWAYVFAWVAMRGISHVARAAQILNWIPLAMLVIVFFATRHGLSHFQPAVHHPAESFALTLDFVLGYIATAAAAGADFGSNSRNRGDVIRGGLVGIALAVFVAGGLAMLGVAGAMGLHVAIPAGVSSPFDFTTAISSVGPLSGIIFFLFAAALLVPTAFCTFIATNSLTTMLPVAKREFWAFAAASGGILLAATGVAENLHAFFGLVGASFAPVCGAMAADYWLAGKRWSGPRHGINWAGFAAWIVGFWIGDMGRLGMGPASWQQVDHPSILYAFIAAFAVYWVLARAGVRPAVVAASELEAMTAGKRHE